MVNGDVSIADRREASRYSSAQSSVLISTIIDINTCQFLWQQLLNLYHSLNNCCQGQRTSRRCCGYSARFSVCLSVTVIRVLSRNR